MNKKAQFYILTAIVLILIAFALVQNIQPATQAKTAFADLTENLARESATAINQAIYEDGDIDTEYLKFFRAFMMFAKTKDAQFRAAYALKQGSNITVHNEMGKEIMANRITIPDKGNTTLKASTITITYNNNPHTMRLEDKEIQLKILAISEKPDEKRIKILEVG